MELKLPRVETEEVGRGRAIEHDLWFCSLEVIMRLNALRYKDGVEERKRDFGEERVREREILVRKERFWWGKSERENKDKGQEKWMNSLLWKGFSQYICLPSFSFQTVPRTLRSLSLVHSFSQYIYVFSLSLILTIYSFFILSLSIFICTSIQLLSHCNLPLTSPTRNSS